MPYSKMFLLLFSSVYFLIILSCGTSPTSQNVDAQDVAADKNSLKITYAMGDSADAVTHNVGLPTSGLNGTSISWATSNNNRITNEGDVNLPAFDSGDVSVTLTATISKGTVTVVKVFSLTVKESIGTIIDIDGNVYKIIRIGSQVWTAENFRSTKYSDGVTIPHVTDSTAWNGLTTAGYCFYRNTTNSDSIKKFGALYNWYCIATQKLAPVGWHVPDTTDWNILENYLIANGYNWDGTTDSNKIAKSMATKTDWAEYYWPGSIGYDMSSNNTSGFSAMPGGVCYRGFGYIGINGYFWSSTEYNVYWSAAYVYSLSTSGIQLSPGISDSKRCGFSVRLVRN
jgi:uncharacterized protein (TIGR02145 family)